MNRLLLIFGGLGLAFWPVGAWCFQRVTPLSDKLCGLLALATAAAFLGVRRGEASDANVAMPEDTKASALAPASALVLLQAVIFPWMPPLMGVFAAVVILAAVLSSWRYAVPLHLGACGLLLLSLPILSRLQFYLGHPLRMASGSLAAAMLRSGGIGVAREGTVLNWHGQLIAIDAPCSGTKMLWAGAYLAFVLVCLYRLDARRSLLVIVLAAIAVALANAIRISALFHLQTTLADRPGWWHDAVGIFCFILAGLGIVASARHARMFSKQAASRGPAMRYCVFERASKPAMALYLAACLLAAATPLLAAGAKSVETAPPIPIWPTEFHGRSLQPIELKDYERRFAEELPGHLAKFTDGTRQYMFQWLAASNRSLHSATDCMAAAGFALHPQPLWVDEEGNRWACSLASRGPQTFRVCERIVDADGHDWQDVSAWYWATLLDKSRGPWWMITILEPIADGTVQNPQ